MVLIIVVVLGTSLMPSGDNSTTAGSVNPSTRSLPWPEEGQSSVLVEGIGARGDLGTKGTQTPVPIASVTKVMTAYVILGAHPLRAGESGPDQLKLARQVMRNKVFRSIVAMPGTTAPDRPGRISNSNALLGTDGVIGVKTGSSTPAGGNLMWAATAPDGSGRDRLVLGVVLRQEPDTSPQQGLQAVFTNSGALIKGVRQWLSTTTEPGKR